MEKPFLDQLRALGWEVIDQGEGFPSQDPAVTMRATFRELILPDVFREAVRSLNLTDGGKRWLTDRQLEELQDQILRQPKGAAVRVHKGERTEWLSILAARRGLGAEHATRTPPERPCSHPEGAAARTLRPFVRGTPKKREVIALLRRWYGVLAEQVLLDRVLAERVLTYCRLTVGE